MAKNVDCCADCSAAAPVWVSVNRGIFLCDDCGSIHRTLGRHVSVVKSLKRGIWPTSLLNLVKELHASGSNEIWEHKLLLDSLCSSAAAALQSGVYSGGTRKPMPNDSASKKQEFIQSKHRYLSFVQRVNKSSRSAQEALNEDLYNVVRTGAVKDSLRYVVLGADPNWAHPQTKMRSLHNASRSGQASQVELLLLWGADPLLEDELGQQAAELALAAGYETIALRLQEAVFEVPDRLTSFITNGRRPDHAHGIHFLEPELSDVSLLNDDQRQARKQSQASLKALGNDQLKNLSNDIHDEVDRRELDEQFAAHNNIGGGSHRHHVQHASSTISPHGSTPFLPVDPRFSSVRNQARQKLALLSAREFIWLIVDLLAEIRRRYGHQQAVELVKISTKLLSRNSDGSQKDGVMAANDHSIEERSPAKQYSSATLNSGGNVPYGSTGRSAKVGPRLRELPSTVSSSDAFMGDGYEEHADDSIISDRRIAAAAEVATDCEMFLHTDAEENDMPDYDDVDDVAAYLKHDAVSSNGLLTNGSLAAIAVVNGHKPPMAVRTRATSSASPRLSGEQLKSHSRHHAVRSGSHSASQTDASMVSIIAQLLDALSGLRGDLKQLSQKVDVLWQERNCQVSSLLLLPTQESLSEATVKITKQIQALKQTCEADDLLLVDTEITIVQQCTGVNEAVMVLVDSFTSSSAQKQQQASSSLLDNLRVNLLHLSSSASQLVREAGGLEQAVVTARTANRRVPDAANADSEPVHAQQSVTDQKKMVMDAAYTMAKNLRSVHTAYGLALQRSLPTAAAENAMPEEDHCSSESRHTPVDTGSHYAVIRPAVNEEDTIETLKD